MTTTTIHKADHTALELEDAPTVLTVEGRRAFIAAAAEKRIAAIEADKAKRGLKNTKANMGDKMKAHQQAKGEWTQAQFAARIELAHEDDPLTDDIRWNPNHPLAAAFDAYLAAGMTAEEAEAEARGADAPPMVAPNWPASEKQVSFIGRLLDERDFDDAEVLDGDGLNRVVFPGERRDAVVVRGGKVLDKKAASALIEDLLQAPYRQGEEPAQAKGLDLSQVPAGLYADPTSDGRLKLKVEHGKPGTRWEGWTFVKDAAEYGHGNRYGLQRPGQQYQGKVEDALRAIVEDPRAAMAAYGRLVGVCGKCGRRLEDEDSVAAGIGPICAESF